MEVEALDDTPVNRVWDLGVRDDTSIFWWQMQGGQIIVLDHYAASGAGVEHFAEEIEKRKKQYGWRDGVDWVPHDAKVKEFGTGKTRVETMKALGLNPQLVPWATFQDGINAGKAHAAAVRVSPAHGGDRLRCARAVQTRVGR